MASVTDEDNIKYCIHYMKKKD